MLTLGQKCKIMIGVAKYLRSIGSYPDFNTVHAEAAIDTINSLFDGVKAAWSTAVNQATQTLDPPYTFTNGAKKKLFAYWLIERFIQEDE